MPVRCEKQDDKFRIVDADTGKTTKNAKGTPVDGGGHKLREACQQQAQAINASLRRAGKI